MFTHGFSLILDKTVVFDEKSTCSVWHKHLILVGQTAGTLTFWQVGHKRVINGRYFTVFSWNINNFRKITTFLRNWHFSGKRLPNKDENGRFDVTPLVTLLMSTRDTANDHCSSTNGIDGPRVVTKRSLVDCPGTLRPVLTRCTRSRHAVAGGWRYPG